MKLEFRTIAALIFSVIIIVLYAMFLYHVFPIIPPLNWGSFHDIAFRVILFMPGLAPVMISLAALDQDISD